MPSSASQMSSVAAPMTLAEHRADLTALFAFFSGGGTSLQLSGWLAFAAAFDVSPGYLAAERVEEAFDEALPHARPGAALSFADFQEALCHLAKAVADKQWKVEYAAEKAARYRYKLKDAEKSRVVPGPEERLESLFGALELDKPHLYRKRAGMPPPPSPAQAAAAAAQAAALQATSGNSPTRSSPASKASPSPPGSVGSLEAQLRALRAALAADDQASAAQSTAQNKPTFNGWCSGSSSSGTTASGTTNPPRAKEPPSAGAGRNSRRTGSAHKRQPGSVYSSSSNPYGSGSVYGTHRAAGYSLDNRAPTPPSGGPRGPSSDGSSPRPGSGHQSNGRSPRRFRVSQDQSSARAVAAAHGITPSPPTTPRSVTPTGGVRPAPPAPNNNHASSSSSGHFGNGGGTNGVWDASSSVFISPRPAETQQDRAVGGRHSKENGSRPGSPRGGSAGRAPPSQPTPYTSEQPQQRQAATSSRDSLDEEEHASAVAAAQQQARVRLRESTNTKYAGGGQQWAHCQQQGTQPVSHSQYYQLSSRGGAAKELSDLDFVHALMGSNGGNGGGAGGRAESAGRKRSAGSAGRHRQAIADGNGFSKGNRAANGLARGNPHAHHRAQSVHAW
jgi:hypothetical protein